jgi:hypothetical protein
MEESKVEVPTVEITVTAEEQELIFKGIRPEGMRYDVFSKVRKDLAKATKLYKGGKYKHISTWVEDGPDKTSVRKHNTFVKDKI